MPRVIVHASHDGRYPAFDHAGHAQIACATCHAYVADAWVVRLPAIIEMEDSMLDAVADRRANSRLSCQIEMTEALDGVEIRAADNDI